MTKAEFVDLLVRDERIGSKKAATETVEAVLNYSAKILEGVAPEPEAPGGFRRVGDSPSLGRTSRRA